MKAFGLGYCCASAWACYGITKAQLPEGVKKAWPVMLKPRPFFQVARAGMGLFFLLGCSCLT